MKARHVRMVERRASVVLLARYDCELEGLRHKSQPPTQLIATVMERRQLVAAILARRGYSSAVTAPRQKEAALVAP